MGVDGRRALDALRRPARGVRRRRIPSQADSHGARRSITRWSTKVQGRTRRQLLDARTRSSRGERRFMRGPRYETLAPKLRAKAEKAFAKYAKKLSRADRSPPEALEVVDAAFRVAGTGSLGCLRVAVLVRGKGGRDGAWIFDMKEEDTPSSACLVRPPRLEPAERVADGNPRVPRPATAHDRHDQAARRVDVRAPPHAAGRQARPRASWRASTSSRSRATSARCSAPRTVGARSGWPTRPWNAEGPRGPARAGHRARRRARGDVSRVLRSGPPMTAARPRPSSTQSPDATSAPTRCPAAASGARMARVLAALPPPPARVLDLGVGTGRELTALLDAGYAPTGLDTSRRCSSDARAARAPVPLVHADFWARPCPSPTPRSTRPSRSTGRSRTHPRRRASRASRASSRRVVRPAACSSPRSPRPPGSIASRRSPSQDRSARPADRPPHVRLRGPRHRRVDRGHACSTRATGAPRSRPTGSSRSNRSMSSSGSWSRAAREALRSQRVRISGGIGPRRLARGSRRFAVTASRGQRAVPRVHADRVLDGRAGPRSRRGARHVRPARLAATTARRGDGSARAPSACRASRSRTRRSP